MVYDLTCSIVVTKKDKSHGISKPCDLEPWFGLHAALNLTFSNASTPSGAATTMTAPGKFVQLAEQDSLACS